MLKNQLLVVQKLFQWEGHDPNWIHRRLLKNHDSIRSNKSLLLFLWLYIIIVRSDGLYCDSLDSYI